MIYNRIIMIWIMICGYIILFYFIWLLLYSEVLPILTGDNPRNNDLPGWIRIKRWNDPPWPKSWGLFAAVSNVSNRSIQYFRANVALLNGYINGYWWIFSWITFGSLWITLHMPVAWHKKKDVENRWRFGMGTPDFTVRHFRDLIWVGPTT